MISNITRTGYLRFSILLLSFAALTLYWLQHAGYLAGGAIAVSKVCWLFTVIVFWYILPIYWALDRSLPRNARLAYCLFMVSMLLRAVVELSMMYISNNWLHIYGIAHDVFSVFFCTLLALYLFRISKRSFLYFLYCASLFVLETLFALYLKEVSSSDGSVFFLDSAPEHRLMLWLTQIAVIVSVVIFALLITSKPSAAFTSRSPND